MVTNTLISTSGKKIILDRTFNSSPTRTAPSKFKVGITQANITVADTDLTLPIPITGTEVVDDCEATTGWTAGTDSAVSLNTTRFKADGAASVSVAKSGTSGTVFSMSKTTTSRDFTSKRFNAWVYITDLAELVATGTALTVRFGSDGSNYYYLDVAIGDLAVGWNYVTFTSATATGTTGSPTITACDYTEFRFNTDLAADTVAADQVLIDNIDLASDDDLLKDFVSGYPSFDYTNLEVTTRCYLTSVEANGFDIDGVLTENTDGTPQAFSISKFTAESKGDSDEFAFVFVDRLL